MLPLYNFVNTITSPTRITKKSLTVIDVIVTKKLAYEWSSTILDLGYSGFLVQILYINVSIPKI